MLNSAELDFFPAHNVKMPTIVLLAEKNTSDSIKAVMSLFFMSSENFMLNFYKLVA